MKPTKTDLKEAVKWLSTKAYEKEDAPILLAEYKWYLVFRVFKFLMFLIALSLPFVLIEVFVKTESLTEYTTFENLLYRVISIYIILGYGNGIYTVFYNHSIFKKKP